MLFRPSWELQKLIYELPMPCNRLRVPLIPFALALTSNIQCNSHFVIERWDRHQPKNQLPFVRHAPQDRNSAAGFRKICVVSNLIPPPRHLDKGWVKVFKTARVQ